MFLGVAFVLLLVVSFARAGLPDLGNKAREDWVLDVTGLCVQGTVVPLLQSVLLWGVLTAVFPDWRGALTVAAPVGFAICFVGLDYLYYWNHRLLHRPGLWQMHLIHHTVSEMDVLATSRNTLWTSALIVYLWVNGAMLYLLADPGPYAAAIALTAVLDLWKHSTLQPPAPLAAIVSMALILPDDHARHHGREDWDVNFGANLKWWDQLHGTWDGRGLPAELGTTSELSLGRKLLWPFS